MPKLAICIASYKSDQFLKELLADLEKQTFKDFKTYIVKEVDNCGKAKNQAVEKALKDKPNYIQMIDADDRVEPTFLEEGVRRLEKGNVDWVICWGNLFGDRKGYIHSTIPELNDLTRHNRNLHSWVMAKRKVFEKCSFPPLEAGVDWSLWLQIFKHGFKGAVVEKELYRKRWHNKNVTLTKLVDRKAVLKSAGLKDKIDLKSELPDPPYEDGC